MNWINARWYLYVGARLEQARSFQREERECDGLEGLTSTITAARNSVDSS